jgi:hypothetical protein
MQILLSLHEYSRNGASHHGHVLSTNPRGFDRNSMAAEGGAYIVGLFLSLILLPTARAEANNAGSVEKKIKLVGYAGLLIFFAIIIPILYTAAPKDHY